MGISVKKVLFSALFSMFFVTANVWGFNLFPSPSELFDQHVSVVKQITEQRPAVPTFSNPLPVPSSFAPGVCQLGMKTCPDISLKPMSPTALVNMKKGFRPHLPQPQIPAPQVIPSGLRKAIPTMPCGRQLHAVSGRCIAIR